MAPKKPAQRTRRTEKALPRKRLSGAERERRIVRAAALFFSEHGFDGSTRRLAARLGVTQALLYRYFPSKQKLIDRVFETAFANRWDPSWRALLTDPARSVEARLIDFYREYLGRSTEVSMRLWMRANLDGLNFAGRFSGSLTTHVMKPIVGELRQIAGLRPLSEAPLMRGERELVMLLHGSMVFLSIRRHVYRMPMPDDLGDVVALHVRSFLPGALEEIRRLHGEAADPSLKIQVLDPPARRK